MPSYDVNGNPLPDDPSPAKTTSVQQLGADGKRRTQHSGVPGGMNRRKNSQRADQASDASTKVLPAKVDGIESHIPATSLRISYRVAGLLMALGVGIYGSVCIMKMVMLAGALPFEIGFLILNVLLAVCVGGASRFAVGRGGAAAGGWAALVMAASLLAGHASYALDYVVRSQGAFAGSNLSSAFPIAMANLTLIHWIAAGVTLLTATAVAYKIK